MHFSINLTVEKSFGYQEKIKLVNDKNDIAVKAFVTGSRLLSTK